jgi:cytochrome c peroxidase
MKRLILLSLLLTGCAGENAEEELGRTRIDDQIQEMIQRDNLLPNTYIEVSNNVTNLGEMLFLDENLSGNQDISCATCHSLATSGDQIPLALGTGATLEGVDRLQNSGKTIRRNSQPLYNLGHNQRFAFHDGRVSFNNGSFTTPESLSSSITQHFDKAIDAQALFPILSNDEMRGQTGENALANLSSASDILNEVMETRVLNDAEYVAAFSAAYPSDSSFNAGHLGNAIGTFIQNRFNVRNTPFDHYLQGNFGALSESQKRGLQTFLGRGQCIRCHSGVNLSDEEFHSVGVPHVFPNISSNADDLGRTEVTGSSNDLYKFKTPGLRNVAKTAPYMHNGTFNTLEEVVDHYNNIQGSLFNYQLTSSFSTGNYIESILVDTNSTRNSIRFNNIDNGRLRGGLNLDQQERADLVNFLRALSD